MAIDIEKMKAKLNAVQHKASKTNFFSPKDGNNYSVRIVPTPDGDPFKEFWFHYDLSSTGGFLCPKKNFGDACAACDFASKLYREKDEESAKIAKKFLPRQRFFSPVLVRGPDEKEGVKVWGYGKNVYQDMLSLTLNPEYGDIADPEKGVDLNLTVSKAPGQAFPMTKVVPARKESKLCSGTPADCKALLETVPDFEKLHVRKTSAEVAALLDAHLSGDQTEEEAAKEVPETIKFGAPAAKPAGKPSPKKAEKNSVDAAFDELQNS